MIGRRGGTIADIGSAGYKKGEAAGGVPFEKNCSGLVAKEPAREFRKVC